MYIYVGIQRFRCKYTWGLVNSCFISPSYVHTPPIKRTINHARKNCYVHTRDTDEICDTIHYTGAAADPGTMRKRSC